MYSKKDNSDLFLVYCHYFPNGKVYVGITSKINPEDRWMANGLGYKNQIRVWRAIQKYGWDNIEHVVIARDVSIQTAVNMEMDLIQLYNATDRSCGYNASPGGWAMSEDGKNKLSELHKGKKLSPETVAKISMGLRGKKPSEKSIERLREYNRTRDYSKMVQPNEAPVLQYDVENGQFIKEYKSINQAANNYNVDPRNIKCCLDEHVVQYIGYLWIDKNKATPDYIEQRLYSAQNPPRYFPVALYNIDNNSIEYYKTQADLCESKNYKKGTVSSAIKLNRVFNKKYRVLRISIPDYIKATGKPYYNRKTK